MSPAQMLNINPDTVRFLAAKAREFQAKEEAVIPADPLSPSEDWVQQVLAGQGDDPGPAEFRATVDDLEPDQQVELVALTWLGRGDYEPDEWDQALAAAGEAWNERAADYLLGMPQLADFLEEGLAAFGYSSQS
jgi:hypothetical protein